MNTLFILPGLNFSFIKFGNEEITINNPSEESTIFLSFLQKIGVKNIRNILICKGPGRFMSLRLFCNIVNTISNEININIYSIFTYEFFSELTGNKIPILLQLNNEEVFIFYNNKIEIINFRDLKYTGEYGGYIKNSSLLSENLIEAKENKILGNNEIINKFLIDKNKINTAIPFYGK